MIGMDVHGEKELQQQLRKLEGSVERRIVVQSIRKAAAPIVREMKRRAPRGATHKKKLEQGKGVLSKSIGVKTKKYPRGFAVAVVGPQWPAGAHGHLVEFGTKQRFRGKSTRARAKLARRAMRTEFGATKKGFTGVMPAQPFARPAYMAKRAESFRLAFELMWEKIRREAERGAR